MDCNTIRTQIKPFLENGLDVKQTRKFIKHIDECSACYEELKMHYFVREGLKRLEDGGNLNLEQEFNTNLEEIRETTHVLKVTHRWIGIIELISVLTVLAILIRAIIVL